MSSVANLYLAMGIPYDLNYSKTIRRSFHVSVTKYVSPTTLLFYGFPLLTAISILDINFK